MLILIAGAIWFLLVTSFLVWKALGAAKNVDGTSVFNLRGLATEESINQSDFGVPRHEPVLLGVNPVTENAKVLLSEVVSSVMSSSPSNCMCIGFLCIFVQYKNMACWLRDHMLLVQGTQM